MDVIVFSWIRLAARIACCWPASTDIGRRAPGLIMQARWLLLNERQVGRGGLAVAAGLELVGDLVAFVQAVEARTLDIGNVDERVLVAAVGSDEAEALGGIEELNCAIDHGRNL